MKMEFPDLPGWTFEIDEVSFGMYEVYVRYKRGGIIWKTGTDPDALLAVCRREARDTIARALQTYKS